MSTESRHISSSCSSELFGVWNLWTWSSYSRLPSSVGLNEVHSRLTFLSSFVVFLTGLEKSKSDMSILDDDNLPKTPPMLKPISQALDLSPWLSFCIIFFSRCRHGKICSVLLLTIYCHDRNHLCPLLHRCQLDSPPISLPPRSLFSFTSPSLHPSKAFVSQFKILSDSSRSQQLNLSFDY